MDTAEITCRTETYLENRQHIKQFAQAVEDKMDLAADKGRSGWSDKARCSQEDLSRMLREHVEKGDPVDVANFCMMLSRRGERILPYADACIAAFEAQVRGVCK